VRARDELRDVILYLDAVQELYPGGIPDGVIRDDETVSAPAVHVETPTLTFITAVFSGADEKYSCPFSGPEGELLAAAISKGLKLGTRQATLLALFRDSSEDDRAGRFRESRRSEIISDLKVSSTRAVVVLGPLAAETFFSGVPFDELRGTWQNLSGLPTLVTHGPDEVLKSPQIKKQFWLDLQQIPARL
jgi:hypothetical protein